MDNKRENFFWSSFEEGAWRAPCLLTDNYVNLHLDVRLHLVSVSSGSLVKLSTRYVLKISFAQTFGDLSNNSISHTDRNSGTHWESHKY
jgi:hypothetical protein